jgi:hypothetical protein
MNLNSRGGFAKTYGVIDNTMLETKGFMFGLNASSSYRFEKGWRVNANLNANSRNFSIQSRGNGMIASSFSVNKDVIKDKLSFSASCNNPFNKYRVDRRETFGGNFTQTNDRRDYFRSFNISMNYKFGKLKESIRKNKRGIRNDDVQGGDS